MKNILLVDDDPIIREGLQLLLEVKGYTVRIAADGKEADKILREMIPDLVITDIIMPEKDGIEVILNLRRNYKNVKIIAISGGGRINAQDHLEIAKQLGVSATLTKPFNSAELYAEIERVLNS